jgi:hypothetical protein
VKRAPTTLKLTYSNLQGKIQFIRETFDFSNKELQKVITGCPTIITRDGKRTLLPIVTYLLELFDGDKKTVCSLVLNYPGLFTKSVGKNLKPKVKYLLTEVFGGNKAALQSAVLLCPRLLGFSLNDRIKPRMESLLNAGQDPSLRIASALDSKKDVFEVRFGVVSNERKKESSNASGGLSKGQRVEAFFMNELHVNSKQVQRMVDRAPNILEFTEITLLRKIQFFRETYNFSNDELGKMFIKEPGILQLNIEDNLKPKVAYFLDLFDGDQESARFVFLRFPALLGCSVEKNLKPKVDFCLVRYMAVTWWLFALPYCPLQLCWDSHQAELNSDSGQSSV